MIVDVHTHIIVPELLRDAAPEDSWRPRVFRDAEGRQVVESGGRQLRSALREFVQIEALLEQQQQAGIDHVLLCPWVALLRDDVPAAEALRSSRLQNEALVRLAQRYPRQVSVLGSVPLQDPELAARELDALMRLPGCQGVEVAASVQGHYLGDDRFRPFWAAAEASGALVFIHPTTRGFEQPVFQDYYLWNSVGNPLETTICAAQMVMAGLLEAHPRLKVLLAHGGGALMALRGRLRQAYQVQQPARARLQQPPDSSLRRFYFDSLTHDQRMLRDLIAFAGAERVLLGSDYPFDMGLERPADSVRSLGLVSAEEQAILGGNAARLLGLPSQSERQAPARAEPGRREPPV